MYFYDAVQTPTFTAHNSPNVCYRVAPQHTRVVVCLTRKATHKGQHF